MCLRGSNCGRRGGPYGWKGGEGVGLGEAERRGSTREAAQAEDEERKGGGAAEHTSEGLPSLGDEEGRSYGQKSQAVRRRRAAMYEGADDERKKK